jgi:5-methyltetrahydrofolate--homocysteine methyltransferase
MIHFTDKQWDRVRSNYRKWWKGELGRPILPMVLGGADPGRLKPDVPQLMFSNCADFSITPEQMIDRMDYDLSCCEFYGDSYPYVYMAHFGPGIAAAFLGAEVEPTPNTVWFHPKVRLPASELHFSYDPDNIWLRRIKDIYRAGMKKWSGNVCMSMTDLGGTMDILASFLTTEGLLFSLVDEPDEIKRLVGEISAYWIQFHREISEIIRGQQGFSDWGTIYSEQPSYMLQCDFCFMISPEMFNTFVRDELSATASRLDKPFYHLDGIGELSHLDTLLSIDSIKGIQWVPGDGEPITRDWSEVFAKISQGGKKIQVYYNLDQYFDEILPVIKRPDDLIKMQFGYPIERKAEALRKLSRFCDVP